MIIHDIAARGIDIKGLPYVINMTLPEVSENYIHRIGRVGRADCMGLAISIVASNEIKEKVWYHKNCSNKSKNNCLKRESVGKGGCTIWLHEGSHLEAIEARLHMKIPQLNPDFSLPTELASMNVEYGEEASALMKDPGQSGYDLHLSTIAPAVKELAELEISAQNDFLIMNYSKMSSQSELTNN